MSFFQYLSRREVEKLRTVPWIFSIEVVIAWPWVELNCIPLSSRDQSLVPNTHIWQFPRAWLQLQGIWCLFYVLCHHSHICTHAHRQRDRQTHIHTPAYLRTKCICFERISQQEVINNDANPLAMNSHLYKNTLINMKSRSCLQSKQEQVWKSHTKSSTHLSKSDWKCTLL